jgi:hypothetical protein
MLPRGLLRPFPMGGWRRGVPQEFIVILLLPLGLLAALAAGQIRSNATQGVPAGRVNTLAIWRR